MITKSKKFYVSFLMAFMMFLSCLMPEIGALSSGKTAFADDLPKTKVYYITDYAGSDEIEKMIIQQTGLPVERQYFPGDELTQLLSRKREDGNAITLLFDSLSSAKNAYVILEIRTRFLPQPIAEGESEPYLTHNLRHLFLGLKGENCEIMFICGTDESFFGSYKEFLSFADIHVNTDVLYLYFATIFKQIAAESGNGDGRFNNATLIFDENFSKNIRKGFKECYFFKAFFIAYIRSVYREEIESGATSRIIFEENNIKVLCHITDDDRYPDRFYDVVRGDEFDWSLDKERFDNARIYAFGATWKDEECDEPYSLKWLRAMFEIRDFLNFDNENFNIYMYNDARHTYSELRDSSVRSAHTVTDINYVIKPFVCGSVMKRFDNWSGNCDITHKPWDNGDGNNENSWLIESYGDLEIGGWSSFMTQEDYDYFFNYSDDWDTAWQGRMIG